MFYQRHVKRLFGAEDLWTMAAGLFVGLVVFFGDAVVSAQSDDPFVDDEDEIEQPTLPEVEVVAEDEPSAVFTEAFPLPSILEGTVFDSPPATGYHADSATSATLVDVPLLDFPGTVDVIPAAVLRDQLALKMEDVLRNVPKAVPGYDPLRPDVFLKMGFEMRQRDFRKNTMLDPTPVPRCLANVERFEVVEGPASAIYGGGQPAGVVNVITKKPKDYPGEQLDSCRHTLDLLYGSFDMRHAWLDSRGPLGHGDGNLHYRINLVYEDANSFRDFGYQDRVFVAPVVTWDLGQRTSVTWEGEFNRWRGRYDTGVALLGGQIDALPIERFLGEPQDFLDYEEYRSSFRIDHVFQNEWTLRFIGYSQASNNRFSATEPVAPVGGTFVARQRQNVDEWQEQYHSLRADLTGEFCTPGNVRHELVVGTEQGWVIANDFTATFSDPMMSPLVIDAANPTYGIYEPVAAPITFDSDFTQNRHGFYVLDHLDISPRWKASVSVRYDAFHQKFARQFDIFGFPILGTPTRDDQDFPTWSPRAGLVFQPIPNILSTYVNYGESFDAPYGGGRAQPNPLEPETGRIWEGGIKAKLLEHLTLTAAGFHIQKDNEVFDAFVGIVPTVKQLDIRSQGAELALFGELGEHWSIIANYSYQDVVITGDSQGGVLEGNRVRNVPFNKGNVWLQWRTPLADCQAVGAALGMVHQGPRPGDLDNTFELPSYTRWDAAFSYDYHFLEFKVLLENLSDERYYVGARDQMVIYPGVPFNVRGVVKCYF